MMAEAWVLQLLAMKERCNWVSLLRENGCFGRSNGLFYDVPQR